MNKNVAAVFTGLILAWLLIPCHPLFADLPEEPKGLNRTVLLNDAVQRIPLRNLDSRRIAVILPQRHTFEPFADLLGRYARLDTFYWSGDALRGAELDESLKLYNTLIFAVPSARAENNLLQEFINTQALGKEVVLYLAGEGRGLRNFEEAAFPILWSEADDEEALRHAAMSVFGGMACIAKLDRDYSDRLRQGHGIVTTQVRLQYLGTECTEINEKLLTHAIDGIMAEAIQARATPGGVVMVVQNGNVIFEKAYGHHTYDLNRPTRTTDIFDIASITKIAATTPSIMRLVEDDLVQLNDPLGRYLWQAKRTNKAGFSLREVLLHEAGFIPYIPFFRDLGPDDIRRDSSESYSVKLADQRYLRTGYYAEHMLPTMLRSRLQEPGKYVYSDISMYMMKEVLEHSTSIPIQQFVQDNFYRPLGMQTAGYNPRERFERDQIVPTEDDRTFRKTLLEGYVHDQGAAMAGGIAGHAGLFASANDLAIYGQLLLNRGSYGGQRYFKPETVDLFTSRQSATSRRGLGFDRREPDPNSSYPSRMASMATYGHTGYTGTALWIDPEKRLIYIFLSNRVHPQVTNKLSSLAIRRRILDVVYLAIQ